MFYKIDNYGNKVELSHDELVINYTPAQLVAAGYDLWDLKEAFVDSGVDPDVFSELIYKRIRIIELGNHLDILVHDKEYCVRVAVAEQGFGLDILIYDKNWIVRYAVIMHGGLDLVYDEYWEFRKENGKQVLDLDTLINDDDDWLKFTVARKLWFKKSRLL